MHKYFCRPETAFFPIINVVYFDQRTHACAKYFFDNFQAFFIVFDHVNACASMHMLVEIHNTSRRKSFNKGGNSNLQFPPIFQFPLVGCMLVL